MKRKATFVLVGFLITLLAAASAPTSARADEFYTFVVQKQEKKDITRWSLQEWLDTRDRMRLMDMWLALHTPSPFEFFVGTDYRVTDTAIEGGPKLDPSFRLKAGAYASLVGLELEHRLGAQSEWQGLFGLRVFGYQQQGTHLTLQLGARSRELSGATLRNATAGADAAVYLTRFFGIEANYRHHFAPTPSALGITGASNALETGGFIDFRFLRVYGQYFRESGASSGIQLGTKLFF
jgi:hypothetical protein